MAEQVWRQNISSNYSKLCKLTEISTLFLHRCLESGVITNDDRQRIGIIQIDYDKNSKFYEIILKKDEQRFLLMVGIMEEIDIKQADDVLQILKMNTITKTNPKETTEHYAGQIQSSSRPVQLTTFPLQTDTDFELNQQQLQAIKDIILNDLVALEKWIEVSNEFLTGENRFAIHDALRRGFDSRSTIVLKTFELWKFSSTNATFNDCIGKFVVLKFNNIVGRLQEERTRIRLLS